jgi:hypothetical protein
MTIKRKVQTKYKLPILNWVAMTPNQVKGTVFSELDDEKLYSIIDFQRFEEQFKLGPAGGFSSPDDDLDGGFGAFSSKRFKKPESISLLEHTRLRNIAISRRKLDMSIDIVIKGVNYYDLKSVPVEAVELLQRMIPTEAEVKAYREYERDKRDLAKLTEEDRFLMQLTKIERLSTKLQIMKYIADFSENLQTLMPQFHAIIAASRSVRTSKKFRGILEIILAFGNYLNSSKRGPAYGFHLQSLEVLMDTKTSDRRLSLLHYIAETVRARFSEFSNFDAELRYIEKAAQVSLENLLGDMSELDKGMELVRRELVALGGRPSAKVDEQRTAVVRDFLAESEDKLKKLKSDCATAQQVYAEVAEYYGESSRAVGSSAFFSIFLRFVRAYRLADEENLVRRRLESANHLEQQANAKASAKERQQAVVNELKGRNVHSHEKQLLPQDQVRGTLFIRYCPKVCIYLLNMHKELFNAGCRCILYINRGIFIVKPPVSV